MLKAAVSFLFVILAYQLLIESIVGCFFTPMPPNCNFDVHYNNVNMTPSCASAVSQYKNDVAYYNSQIHNRDAWVYLIGILTYVFSSGYARLARGHSLFFTYALSIWGILSVVAYDMAYWDTFGNFQRVTSAITLMSMAYQVAKI